ncbi:MAG: FAD-dependent oxidoreductase, partial [Anaerolineales bacterium]|nr:FAD-dependent oxidoreductase [Anaerolineales bacterium]
MEKKSITIIGAGIAGLAAGSYGQMNNYRTQIFEMHDLPGGVCTSWKRKGYTINGCIGWLVGSSPNDNNYYRIWEELGAVQGRKMINHEEFIRVVGKDGKPFVVYSDIDRLEQHMKEQAPQDVDVIDVFINAARICAQFNPQVDKAPEVSGFLDAFKFLIQSRSFLKVVSKWKSISMQDFAKRFSSPFMRQVLPSVFPDVLALLMTLGWLHRKAAGYPIGGSLEFAVAIEQNYLDLGGKIHYHSAVAEILVENDQAVGVRLRDGSTHRSDIVISAADGHTTIFDMLGGRYIDAEIRGYYTDLPLFPPLIHVALGVARSFEGLPHAVVYPLDPPMTIGGGEQKTLPIEIYNFDPTLAPPNKTTLRV